MTRLQWTDPQGNPVGFETIGFIGDFLDNENPAPAAEQFNRAYAHGGGWHPFEGFKMLPNGSLKYPGDPAYPVLAKAALREEKIFFYPHAWVAIIQPDGTYEVARLD